MKKLHIIFIVSLLVIIMLPAGFSQALELNYPTLSGYTITDTNTLLEYVRYVYIFAFMTAGFIGVLTIVISGFQILVFAGNASKIEAARSRIGDAILGILLLLFTYIIVLTINPSLTSLKMIDIAANPGLYAGKQKQQVNFLDNLNPIQAAYAQPSSSSCVTDPDSCDWEPVDLDVSDISADGYEALKLECSHHIDDSDSGIVQDRYGDPSLLINLFYDINFGDPDQTTNQEELRCGEIMDISSYKSFSAHYKTYGVYYYSEPNCQGSVTFYSDVSSAQTQTDDIPWFVDPINPDNAGVSQAIASIDIESPKNRYGFLYGVILTKNFSQQGECSTPLIGYLDGTNCINIVSDSGSPEAIKDYNDGAFYAASAYVFRVDPNYLTNPYIQNTTFWSENLQKTVSKYDIDPDLLYWVYDKNSTNPQYISYPEGDNGKDPSDPGYLKYYRQDILTDGNLDGVLYQTHYDAVNTQTADNQANNKFPPVPTDECLPYREEDDWFGKDQIPGITYDHAYDNPKGNNDSSSPIKGEVGIRTCIGKITTEDQMYAIYTHNESIKDRQCLVLDHSTLIFDKSNDPTFAERPRQLTQFETIYATYVIPMYKEKNIYIKSSF